MGKNIWRKIRTVAFTHRAMVWQGVSTLGEATILVAAPFVGLVSAGWEPTLFTAGLGAFLILTAVSWGNRRP